ncbi:C3H1-type domain-containing protein [Durusdinium trenchii]|uniref:C3H1-type domain-containing protein n=1 Tax=Durusdinium trenchii TaxID=1381693 RepID=A0ABP0NAM5_9DINO
MGMDFACASGSAHVALSAAAAQAAQAGANMEALQASMSTLSTSMLSVAPIAAFSGVILALCLVGFAGRKMLKQLLGRLWAQEIKEHQQSREMFQKMASKLRQAASDLKCARDCSEKLEEAFEVVAEAAEELCGMAEDAELIECDYDLDDMNAKLQELFDAAERAVPAFGELQKALLALDEVQFLAHEPEPHAVESELHMLSAASAPAAGEEQNIPLVTEIEESEPEQQESPPEEKHGELPDIEELLVEGWTLVACDEPRAEVSRAEVSRSPQRVATSVTLAQRVPSGLPSVLLADGAPRGPLCSAAPPTWTVPRPLRNLPWQVAALEEQRKQTPMQNASELRMVQRSHQAW